jgi:dihydrolipoamide dehydrogenase
MANDMRVDAVVIGSGPGGYHCGIRLGQLGIKTAVIEKEYAGGVCLNVGCIPSKALIYAAKTYEKMGHADDIGIMLEDKPSVDMGKMQEWKGGVVKKLTGGVKQLVKANGGEFIMGTARLDKPDGDGHKVIVDSKDGKQVIRAKNVVLATGSRPIEIPGFKIDQERIIDSTGALALTEVPKRMVVIGGGYIGLELGTVYAKLGAKVTVVEALDSILTGVDKDCTAQVAKSLRNMGIEVMLQSKAKRWEDKGDRAVVTIETKDGTEATIDADKVLLSVGRRPNSENLGLEELGIKTEKGFLEVDSQLRTNVAGIYAIGDVAGGMMLAHKAYKDAEVAAEVIAGHRSEFDARTIPYVVFTDPEVAATGLTEEEAVEQGLKVKVGKFPFAALGRALSVNDTTGFIKIVADADSGEILGFHMCGNGVSDLISEGALAIEMGAVLHDVALTIHPHPTLSESVKEAAQAALGEAIHIVNR